MTREEAKRYIGELKMYAKSQGWDEEYQIACDVAMNELEQEPILDKIYCTIHPLSIMSTPALEHKAIMQIAEMLEPLCLSESEDT